MNTFSNVLNESSCACVRACASASASASACGVWCACSPVREKVVAVRADGQACYKICVPCESEVLHGVLVIHAQVPSTVTVTP
jgi:hypothetical protein